SGAIPPWATGSGKRLGSILGSNCSGARSLAASDADVIHPCGNHGLNVLFGFSARDLSNNRFGRWNSAGVSCEKIRAGDRAVSLNTQRDLPCLREEPAIDVKIALGYAGHSVLSRRGMMYAIPTDRKQAPKIRLALSGHNQRREQSLVH